MDSAEENPTVDPAAVMRELRRAGEVSARQIPITGHEADPGAGSLWKPRVIESHRPWIGKIYVVIRRWIYREISLSVEDSIRRQETINGVMEERVGQLEKNASGPSGEKSV
jgi:hypothetical protein